MPCLPFSSPWKANTGTQAPITNTGSDAHTPRAHVGEVPQCPGFLLEWKARGPLASSVPSELFGRGHPLATSGLARPLFFQGIYGDSGRPWAPTVRNSPLSAQRVLFPLAREAGACSGPTPYSCKVSTASAHSRRFVRVFAGSEAASPRVPRVRGGVCRGRGAAFQKRGQKREEMGLGELPL